MKRLQMLFALGLFAAASACTSAGSDDVSAGGGSTPPPIQDQPQPAPVVETPLTTSESSSLLSQGTFGPSMQDIAALENASASAWVAAQFDEPMSLHLPNVLAVLPNGGFRNANGEYVPGIAADSFVDTAIRGDDQLRQRMAYALSQILVVSGAPGSSIHFEPHVQAAYMDILVRNAFGNYRDVLEEVTYSPAMASYLTYFRNRKANDLTGAVPDENYAREIMQLFTIGLVELNMDGTPRLQNGQPIETYTNEDIVGLSRVFTGLSYDAGGFWSSVGNGTEPSYLPLRMYENFHSEKEKTFLGTTIPAGVSGVESIDRALDVLFDHPNVAPFISRQLIQRFVTSNPKPEYVQRVAQAFESGSFTMPNGAAVGEGQRGDLKATIAAVLLDAEARDESLRDTPEFGKIREPYLRFVHWARAFNVNQASVDDQRYLWNAENAERLGQLPLRASSVFNFYRPGYTAPGSATSEAGLVAPELQILNATSLVGGHDVLTHYIFSTAQVRGSGDNPNFVPDYSAEIALAETPQALVDHLDTVLAGGKLEDQTKTRMVNMIDAIEITSANRESDLRGRVEFAIFLTMTTPEYIVQR